MSSLTEHNKWLQAASICSSTLSQKGVSAASIQQFLAGQTVTNAADRERLARLMVAAYANPTISRLL